MPSIAGSLYGDTLGSEDSASTKDIIEAAKLESEFVDSRKTENYPYSTSNRHC